MIYLNESVGYIGRIIDNAECQTLIDVLHTVKKENSQDKVEDFYLLIFLIIKSIPIENKKQY